MHAFEDVISAALEVQNLCREKNWRFCFIGGIAVQRWGSPRYTQDVDLTLLTELGREEETVDAALQRLQPRKKDAARFALLHRVLLARTPSGIDVDISLGALPFEERSIERSSSWDVGLSGAITTCSAEDLLVYKIFAGRERDWSDAESVLARQHQQLNRAQIRFELQPLLELKDDTESLAKFNTLAARVDERLANKA